MSRKLHNRTQREMAAQYLCMVSGVSSTDKDISEVINAVMQAEDGVPGYMDNAFRMAGKSLRKRMIAAVDMIREVITDAVP